MTVLKLGGQISQAFSLAEPPATSFRYFAQNQDLLEQFLGHDRVLALGDGVYRVRLNPHGALGLTLQPSFDVAFIEHPPSRVEMRSLRATLHDSSHDDAGFDAHFEGEALFVPEGQGTRVTCAAQMKVVLTLPAVLAWMPAGPLEALGSSIIHAAMHALGGRLVPIMQKDIQKWVAREAAKLG